jgi:hypothetical protein
MSETLTVPKLGVDSRLCKTLSNTNTDRLEKLADVLARHAHSGAPADQSEAVPAA